MMNQLTRCTALAASLCLVPFAPQAAAQEAENTASVALTPEQAAAAQAAVQAASNNDKPAYPPFAKVIEGLTEVPGLMPLYQPKEGDATKDHTMLLCRVPASLLNQDLLFATSISRGQMSGFQWADSLVRWRIIGKQLVLEAPPVSYVSGSDADPIHESITRTYRPYFLAALPIKTMAGKDPVVDLGQLIFSDIASPPGNAQRINRSLSSYAKVKNFPLNTLIDADLAMPGSRGSHSTVGVAYSFRKLPSNTGFTPRPADERVGYFVTERQDFTVDASAREQLQRYVARWNLQKQDPSLRLSPPKEPIVFVIEDTVPIRYRRWVRAGIEEWNKAFEEIGYVDAVVVQQQTSTNEFADVDPEDARYNFIRWIVSGRGFAMGPSRIDPRTGEILDADIIVDDGIVRFFTREIDLFGPQALASLTGPALLDHYEMYPEFTQLLTGPLSVNPHADAEKRSDEASGISTDSGMRAPALDGPLFHGSRPTDAMFGDAARRDASRHVHTGGDTCTLAVGLQRQLMLGKLALTRAGAMQTATGKQIPDELLGQVIKDLVSHEVGHTLGLRHNFKASSWLSVDEIKKRRDEGTQPTTASVMDYNALLFFAGDKLDDLETFASPTIGPYDHWAIEYGYSDPDKNVKLDDHLNKIAGRAGEDGLDFATDEDVMFTLTPDPLANRWDHGSDPAEWAKSRAAISKELLVNVQDWAIAKDEPLYYLRPAVDALMFEQGSGYFFLSRVVGGQYVNRGRLSDGASRPALVTVPVEEQKAALEQLKQTVFSPEFGQLDPELLNNLASSRWNAWSGRNARVDYPIHERVLNMQSMSLMALLSPQTLQRVYDAELKAADGDVLTLAELLTGVRDAVWSEIDDLGKARPAHYVAPPSTQPSIEKQADKKAKTDDKPGITSTRRNLQAQWISAMQSYALVEGQIGRLSPDIPRTARLVLRDLAADIDKSLKDHGKKIDFATRAHLVESKSMIERILDADYQAR